jgi:UDPglucose--hexose-1-phosphate uridylyltransferase
MSNQDHSHARRNQLTGEWVLVSPHRSLRPWQGQIENTEDDATREYDPNCYLCPGNERANGERNPDYSGTFVFENDFPALSDVSDIETDANKLFEARPEAGCCRVVCYSERHDLRLATMSADNIARSINTMIGEFRELDTRDGIAYVQIFENRGQMMGCSNAHPHAQIWATENLPNEPRKELESQQAYFEEHASRLLLDYLAAELADGSRLVSENELFVALVPYWAVWPFETLLLPRRKLSSPDELNDAGIQALAAILKSVLVAYDNLFAVQAPYSMGFHPRPSDGRAHPEWQFHAHLYPPLLQSATIRKHLVGFEMLGMPQRDLTPELAAEKLRDAT